MCRSTLIALLTLSGCQDSNDNTDYEVNLSRPVVNQASTDSTPKFDGMAFVPAGEFFMGCNSRLDHDCIDEEKPGHMVYLDAYYIDMTEVTVEAYGACVKAGRCDRPPRKGRPLCRQPTRIRSDQEPHL